MIDGNRDKRGGHKLISLKSCSGIFIYGLRLQNAPNYTISFIDCEHIICDSCHLHNNLADGIDLDNSRFVRISNCYIDSHDDAICLKSSPALGCDSKTSHITINNCNIASETNCFKLGTETACDVNDVVFSNSTIFRKPSSELANSAISIQTVDGARVSNFIIQGITIEENSVICPMYIRLGSRCRKVGWEDADAKKWSQDGVKPPGKLENIIINNVIVQYAKQPIIIEGIRDYWIENVQINNFNGTFAPKDDEHSWPSEKDINSVVYIPDKYPSAKHHKPLPAWCLDSLCAGHRLFKLHIHPKRNKSQRPPNGLYCCP